MRERTSGVLLHPTSLSGRHGVGDLGAAARDFAERLAEAGVAVWQMLPVTPAGAFDSPYDCRSTRAGHWLLISAEEAAAAAGVELAAGEAPDGAGLAAAARHKDTLLRGLWRAVRDAGSQRRAVADWRRTGDRATWLDDWALFAALDARHRNRPWTEWPVPLRDRSAAALARARRELADEIGYQIYLQYLFARQFDALRQYACEVGLRLCGDLPMYPAHHSVDVWCHSELFDLAADGRPAAVAGVPPDAFANDGQLWGNPVYRWPEHRRSGYRWWIDRLGAESRRFDLLRLDHFRGFVAYWRVELPAENARGGRWRRGPGHALFDALRRELGTLEMIAEDLGHITPAVRRLRRRLGLPGMRVLQFAFDDPASEHLPERGDAMTVAYSGTHDNDTLVGWLEQLEGTRRERLSGYLGTAPATPASKLAEHLLRRLFDSPAGLVVVPAQDILGLGGTARMNRPGTVDDNWQWRLNPGQFDDRAVARLARLVAGSGRGRPT